MNMTLSKNVLKFLSPKHEEERQQFRMALSKTMANAEDVTRTVRCMNGHLAEHIAQWKKTQT